MKIKLVLPSKIYAREIELYKANILNSNMIHGTGDLENKTVAEWIQKCEENRHGKNLPTGYVPATTFIAIRESDNKIVGSIQVRHRLNESLLQDGGHIGYMVAVDERQKGYCKEMLRQCLLYCKELEIDKVLITCKKSNIGSAKVILANQGILENEVDVKSETYQRYWIDLNGSNSEEFVTPHIHTHKE